MEVASETSRLAASNCRIGTDTGDKTRGKQDGIPPAAKAAGEMHSAMKLIVRGGDDGMCMGRASILCNLHVV